MSIDNIHPDFKLNGISFTEEALKDFAYNFIKEGEPFEKSVGNFLSDWLDDSLTIEVQTSGSTGTPKIIALQKQQMVNSALATGNFFDLRPGNAALLSLSADYIAGKMMLVRAITLGLELDCVAPSSSPLRENGKVYDFGAMVPMQVQHSLDKINKIMKLIVGGAPVSFGLKQRLQSVNTRIFETYGMTETITHIAVKEINTSGPSTLEDAGLSASQNDKVGQAVEALGEANSEHEKRFKALPNVTLSVDDRSCLVIDAPDIASQTVITNDVVNLVSKTEFEWLGRHDNVINSGGVKLHPEKIEERLAPLINQRFFVAGVTDAVLGQKLVVVVEGAIDIKKLLTDIAALPSIKKYEIPKNGYSLSEFKEAGNGKISRMKTLEMIST